MEHKIINGSATLKMWTDEKTCLRRKIIIYVAVLPAKEACCENAVAIFDAGCGS